MKTACITILLFLLFTCTYGQTAFLPDKTKDSLWIKQLLRIQNQQQQAMAKNDSTVQIEWDNGSVIYSADHCLRIGQVSGKVNGIESAIATTVQYCRQNRSVELKLPKDTDNYDFQDYPVTNIYKLPSAANVYLICSKKTEKPETTNDDSYNNALAGIEKIQVATMARINKDSLEEIAFKTDADNSYSETATVAEATDVISGNSLYLNSHIKASQKPPVPYLKFDAVKNELSFLAVSCGGNPEHDEDGGCNLPYSKVYSGIFKYNGYAFTLEKDTGYFYPSLASLSKTIAIKRFKTGRYITKATATTEYKEIGEGVLSVLQVDYTVMGQHIGYVDEMFDEKEKLALAPSYKTQKDSSLIFLITDSTTPNHGGECGSCQYDDSGFWLIKPNSEKLLFSFSESTGSGYTTYSYNDGKAERSGKFYLENNSASDEKGAGVDDAYWLNNATYVVRVGNETMFRNFYINFVTVNNKTVAKLVVGKLEYKKRKY